MINRKLKQLNYFDYDIEPRLGRLEGLEGKRKFEEEEFGKKVRIGKFPEPFDGIISILGKMLGAHQTEDDKQIKLMIELLGDVLGKQRDLNNATVEQLQKIFRTLVSSGFPTDYKLLFDTKYMDTDQISDRRSAFNGFLIRTHLLKTNLQNTNGTLTLQNPMWKYVSTGPRSDEDYEFRPVPLSEIDRMPAGWYFDMKHKAMLDNDLQIEDDGDLRDTS